MYKVCVLISCTIVCAMLLPECVIRSFKNPDIKAIGPKSWMLGYTMHLHFWFLVLYLLPNLADFCTANAFVSRWHWLAHSTFAPSYNKRKTTAITNKIHGNFQLKKTQFLSFEGVTMIEMRMNQRSQQLPVCVSKTIRLPFAVFFVWFGLRITGNSAWLKAIRSRSDIHAIF